MKILSSPFVIQTSGNEERNVLLSMVVPTYNESESIEGLINGLIELLDRELPHNYEIIVVDDNSSDRTGEIVDEMSQRYPQVKMLKRTEERGLSSAVIRGWQMSCGEILGAIDGDLQHPIIALKDLLEVIEMSPFTDLAVASRNIQKGGIKRWHVWRRMVSKGARILGFIFIPGIVSRVSDPMSGYFLLRREAIAGRMLKPLGYKILLEVIAKGDIRNIAEVGYVFQGRTTCKSKVGFKVCWEYILQLIHLRKFILRIKTTQ